MQNYIKAYSIGEAWLLSLQAVIAQGVEIKDDQEPIIEVLPLWIEIIQPTLPDKIIDAYGDTRYLQFLSKNFTDLTPILDWGYSYAQRLYSYNGINQIDYAIDKLSSNPFSKSVTISLLNAQQDRTHTPCLTTLDFKIRDEVLIINTMFRSQDIGKKMYGDALEILKIGNYILKKVPAKTIILIDTISSAHIYRSDLEMVRSIIDTIETGNSK